MSGFVRLPVPICAHAECPLWWPATSTLYYSDIPKKRVHAYVPSTQKHWVFSEGANQVGGIAYQEDTGLIFFGDKHIILVRTEVEEGKMPQKLVLSDLAEGERFNDITTDAAGRVLAGTMVDGQTGGRLFLYDKAHPRRRLLLDDLGISNGMTFSLDNSILYHTDSRDKTIYQATYDADLGVMGPRRVFFKPDSEDLGTPDGITRDANGNIWAACYGGGCVLQISPQGQILQKLDIEVKQPTSVMWGGPDLTTLFVTSSAENADDLATGTKDNEKTLLGGYVYAMENAGQGLPEFAVASDYN